MAFIASSQCPHSHLRWVMRRPSHSKGVVRAVFSGDYLLRVIAPYKALPVACGELGRRPAHSKGTTGPVFTAAMQMDIEIKQFGAFLTENML